MSFVAIVPARFASTRLPGKPLADIVGRPMIVRVRERALASGAKQVIVATDNKDVVRVIEAVRGEVCLTRPDHQSRTERLAEVIEQYGFSDNDIVVNVQGDEPLIPPEIITQVANNLAAGDASMATLAVPIVSHEELSNPNVVKVIRDVQGHALSFSRTITPPHQKFTAQWEEIVGNHFLCHIGIYAYRAGFIRRYVSWPMCPSELTERLEQLRVLSHGEKIHVAIAKTSPGVSVDTPEDLEQVRALCAQHPARV